MTAGQTAAALELRPAAPITPYLWFDGQAEEAAEFYCSLFADSAIDDVARYTETGREVHGREPGSAMTVNFRLAGQPFVALNGGPQFPFTEAVSFMVTCETQAELDALWDRLTEGGDPAAQQCGWCKDCFGVSWQVVPAALGRYLGDPDPGRAARAMEAMLRMKKLDVAELERAAAG
jgi:predicted 3-demethylubiquinone-9 3-methyltransferase (glyoxalase superfamily)